MAIKSNKSGSKRSAAASGKKVRKLSKAARKSAKRKGVSVKRRARLVVIGKGSRAFAVVGQAAGTNKSPTFSVVKAIMKGETAAQAAKRFVAMRLNKNRDGDDIFMSAKQVGVIPEVAITVTPVKSTTEREYVAAKKDGVGRHAVKTLKLLAKEADLGTKVFVAKPTFAKGEKVKYSFRLAA